MTIQHIVSRILFVVVASITASCSWIPTYIPDSGGEIVPRPATKSPLFGHVHAVINQPDRITSDCFTTRQRMAARHVRKPYFFHFQQLPPPGSVVRVFYHEHSSDHDCVAAQAIGAVS